MGFFKKIDTVCTSSESFKRMQRTEVDIQIEANIERAGIQKFATSDYGDLYLRENELGGFLILETIIVSATNFKSKKGSALTFISGAETLKLESDEHKVESDFSKALNKSITKIDYNISVEESEELKKEKYDEVRFEINGNDLLFSVLTS
tara:strand:- start:22 stop:471 length:450 start_codon:yes stop_codon:yes gene_type:complete